MTTPEKPSSEPTFSPSPTSETSAPTPPKKKKSGWLWKSLLGVLLVLVAFYCIGFFLPEEYTAEITVNYDAPPEKVWSALQDPKTTPIAGSRIQNVMVVSDEGEPKKVWIEDLGESKVKVTTVEQTKQKFLKRTLEDSVIMSMVAVMELEMNKTETGTRLKAKHKIKIELGTWHVPVFRCIMFFANGAEVGLRDYLKRVGKHANATPTFVDE